MKLLGHAWVAANSFPQGNKKLLILGSIIPEIMFYTDNNPFKYEEIHEGGEKVLNHILKNNPELTDFALGMISHSKKYGADKFNRDSKLKILGYKGINSGIIRKEIMDVMNVDKRRSSVLAHNLLELAVEISIIREHKNFVDDFLNILKNECLKKVIADLLSETFYKPKLEIRASMNELFAKAKTKYFKNAHGLASLWKELETNDPDFETAKLAEFLIKTNKGFGGKEWVFIEECIKWTNNNLTSLLVKSKQ